METAPNFASILPLATDKRTFLISHSRALLSSLFNTTATLIHNTLHAHFLTIIMIIVA